MSSIPDRSDIERHSIELIRRHTPARPYGGHSDVCSRVLAAVESQASASTIGGKRLRARLALAAHSALGSGTSSAMLDLACAIEIFQTAALIHDDIIDDSDLRRGHPSAHKALGDELGDPRIGRGLGLMMGDVLATCSIDVAADASRSLPNGQEIVSSFLAMQRDVGMGQVLDLAVELAPLSEPDRLAQASLNVFRWKTASYTTIAPLELGFLASGSLDPASCARAAHAIGEPLGVAFQLEDDLLDVVGTSSATGKPVGGDIREGKRTVLLADAIDAATPSDRATLIGMFDKDARTDDDVETTIRLFHDTGALDRSRRRISALWSHAVRELDALGLEGSKRDLMRKSCMDFVPMMMDAKNDPQQPLD